MIKFRALEDFFSPEMESQYCRGLIYTARPETDFLADDEETRFLLHKNVGLHFCVGKWLNQGKIEIVEADSKLSGTGVII